MFRVFDNRSVVGGLDVDDNARWLSNCFHAERQLLHSMAGALPRVPDFKIKIMLGTHVWDTAQTLRGFSQRLNELRQHSEYPARPDRQYEDVLSALDLAPSPAHQIAGIYQGLIPALTKTYDAYIAACDPLIDEPTVRMLVAARLRHSTRQSELLTLLPELVGRDSVAPSDSWLAEFQTALGGSLPNLALRRGETRAWREPLRVENFARPGHFRFESNHGIDRRVIYGAPDEFYFPLDPEFLRHYLHHMVDAEMVAAELMACNIHEFPNMPLAFHIDMARQVWDEVRHARVQWDILDQMGVKLGEYPVFHGYDLEIHRKNLLDRLILFNRSGEAGAAWRHAKRSHVLRENGYHLLARLFDYLHADEISHVVNGSRWSKYLFDGSRAELEQYRKSLEEEFQNSVSELPGSNFE